MGKKVQPAWDMVTSADNQPINKVQYCCVWYSMVVLLVDIACITSHT